MRLKQKRVLISLLILAVGVSGIGLDNISVAKAVGLNNQYNNIDAAVLASKVSVQTSETLNTINVKNTSEITQSTVQKKYLEKYVLVEEYETEMSDKIEMDIRYDKYDVYPHYLVSITSKKIYIYEKPSTSSKKINSLRYGNKIQVEAKILNETEEEWYAVKWTKGGKENIGYVNHKYAIKKEFQIDKMAEQLDTLTTTINEKSVVYIKNYKNSHGWAPKMPDKSSTDEYGNRRSQAAAGYYESSLTGEFRYIPDGMLGVIEQIMVRTDITDNPFVINKEGEYVNTLAPPNSIAQYEPYMTYINKVMDGYTSEDVYAVKIYIPTFDESLWIDEKYLSNEDTAIDQLTQAIIVDRENQTIVVFEHDEIWKIISMSYSSTGKSSQYAVPTPLGYYMAQQRKTKFNYVKDGTDIIAGFAPYVIRFSGGGYLHGVPMSYRTGLNGEKISPTSFAESLTSLGTTPQSHMCVRNYTSHAKFMYDWVDIGNCAIIVIE